MRSWTSSGTPSGPPGVQVKPGTASGSGWTSRYESRKPASASASADRPVDGVGDLRPDGGDRRRPVEMRRRVEVARQERREAGGGERWQHGQVLLDRGQPHRLLEVQRLRERGAVADLVRPIRVRREVDVADGHEPARQDLDPDIDAVRAGRIDDREPRDDLRAVARVPAQRIRDDARVVLALLDADDVGARCVDNVDDLRERLGTASALQAPVPRVQVQLVAAVEDVQVQDANDGRLGDASRRGPDGDRRPAREREQARNGETRKSTTRAHPDLQIGRQLPGGLSTLRGHRVECLPDLWCPAAP